MKSSGGRQRLRTHDVRAVPGVDQDLVVGVGFALHLLRAVRSGRLPFATGRKTFRRHAVQTKKERLSEGRKGGSPVRHGRCDVSVVEAGVPRKQDDASVAEHAMEKQLRATTREKSHLE